MRVELHFLGLVIDLVYINTEYWKQFSKYQGLPVLYNEGGKLYFEFPYGEQHIRVLERMLTVDYKLYKLGYPVDEGKIVFYDANGDILKTWRFKDAPVVYWKCIFDNERGMKIKALLSPAIQDYGCRVVRYWHITPIKEETYQSPIIATEETKEETEIVKVQFIDANGNRLTQTTISGVEEGNATNFLYGNKLRIKVITKNAKDGTKIDIKLKGISANTNQEFLGIDNLNWKLEIGNNECETELFMLPLNWYNEDFETYNYNSHTTIIKADELNAFAAEVTLEGKTKTLPEEANKLKPIAYRRNYEELIGLFHTDNSGKKDLVENYENKFSKGNSEISALVDAFIEHIGTEDLTIEGIQERVKTDAKKLWELAITKVQGGSLDDRPLYWARNKMQVQLKRHPLFENDIEFENSLVNSGSVLDKIIISFEELSRNYTDVDFSGVTGKKLLITGFDPFILDPTKRGNPLQSNPSGINALALHGKTIGDYYIQTFIAPVRYKDFDEFKDSKGIIEKFVTPFLSKVDIIMTVSQGGVFRFDVDRFPAKNRGGFTDNIRWGNGSNDNRTYFKQLTIGGKEFYETTLPYKKIVPDVNNPSDTFWIYFNQTYNPYSGGDNNSDEQGTVLRAKLEDVQSLTSVEGSGGDYLSNEIFYRVAKLRAELKPNLPTGHLHIPLTQSSQQGYDIRGNRITIDINPQINKLIKEIERIIEKM